MQARMDARRQNSSARWSCPYDPRFSSVNATLAQPTRQARVLVFTSGRTWLGYVPSHWPKARSRSPAKASENVQQTDAAAYYAAPKVAQQTHASSRSPARCSPTPAHRQHTRPLFPATRSAPSRLHTACASCSSAGRTTGRPSSWPGGWRSTPAWCASSTARPTAFINKQAATSPFPPWHALPRTTHQPWHATRTPQRTHGARAKPTYAARLSIQIGSSRGEASFSQACPEPGSRFSGTLPPTCYNHI